MERADGTERTLVQRADGTERTLVQRADGTERTLVDPTGRSEPPSAPCAPATADPELLRRLHDEHAPVLWRYVVGLTGGDGARAQDVVQETMLRAWRHPSVVDQSHASARGWLFTVARRIVIDEWRSARARREVVTDDPPEHEVSDAALSVLDRNVVAAAVRTLSDEHRDVLWECYFRGSSVTQAARNLGIPPGTVKSRTHYALRALRLAVEELGVCSD